jgi:hypothetical protein
MPSQTITFTSAVSGTGTYTNTSYYQLDNTYECTPETPSVWDGAYSFANGCIFTGTFLGSSSPNTVATTQGGGTVSETLWMDYDLPVTAATTIGNTWQGQAPLSFSLTTGGNTENVNYIQSSGSTSTNSAPNFDWLLLAPFLLVGVVALMGRKKIRF